MFIYSHQSFWNHFGVQHLAPRRSCSSPSDQLWNWSKLTSSGLHLTYSSGSHTTCVDGTRAVLPVAISPDIFILVHIPYEMMALWRSIGDARVTSAPKPNQRTKKGPSKAALTPMWASYHMECWHLSGPHLSSRWPTASSECCISTGTNSLEPTHN